MGSSCHPMARFIWDEPSMLTGAAWTENLWESHRSPSGGGKARSGGQQATPAPGGAQLLCFPAFPWPHQLVCKSLQASHTCCSSLGTSTQAPRMLASPESLWGTRCCVLSPGKAAEGHEPLVLWAWVWGQRASCFPSCLFTN